MANLMGFNAAEVEPSSFEPIPAGWYNAIITDSNWEQTKDGKGRYLKLKFQIYDGEYKGRVVFARLNIDNQNAQAVEIARGQLSSICRAVNVLTPNDSCELHNLPLSINVACRKIESSGEITNDIKGYRAKGTVQQQATAQPAANHNPPWKR